MPPLQTVRVKAETAASSDSSPSEALRDQIEQRFRVPPWVLLVEVFIGLGWIRAAVEKIIDLNWWNGAVLTGFLESHSALTLPWYQAFVDNVVEPNILAISVTVVLAQLFAGLSLISGSKVLAGLATGAFLNLSFIAAGAVNPSIFYLVCEAALVLWILQSERRVSKRPLRLLATASFAVALLNVPFITTIDPQAVIEDPAIVLVTLGLLTAVASRVGVRNFEKTRGPDLGPYLA